MKRDIALCAVLILQFLAGCSTFGASEEQVTLSGNVVDAQTGRPLVQVQVEISTLERHGLLSMGTYEHHATAITDQDGFFSFTVSSGKTIEIFTRSPETGRIGFPFVLTNVKSDRSDLVVEHHDRPASDFAPGPSEFPQGN